MTMTLSARSHTTHQLSRPATLQPRRSAAAHGASRPALAAPLLWFRRKLRSRPGTTLAHCMFALAGGVILFNALAFQREASPRTFIGETAASAPPQAAAAPALPLPPARPAELTAAPARPVPAASPQSQGAPAAQPAPRAARDPIGDLIRTGQPTPSALPQNATQPAERAETRPVLAAQRALNRVGAGPVKADGVFGEETRAAIERFERERRIPVTRELGPRTLRELTAASGMRME